MTASILIGVHGAALTNTVFQPPVESTVIEIGFNPRKVMCEGKARGKGKRHRFQYAWKRRD